VRKSQRLLLSLVLSGAGIVYYVAGLVSSLRGYPPPYPWLLSCATLGAVGIELASSHAVQVPATKRQVAGARAWSVALALGVAVLTRAHRVHPWYLGLVLFWPVLAVGLLMGVWWPRQAARSARRLRPGFVVGGVSWGLLVLLGQLTGSYLLWSEGGRHVRPLPAVGRPMALLLLAVTPVYVSLPVRLLFEGVPRRADAPTSPWTGRAILALMAVMGSWGYIDVLRLLTVQPALAATERGAAIALASVAWATVVLCVRRVWAARERRPDAGG
jgi:hypothetical protein